MSIVDDWEQEDEDNIIEKLESVIKPCRYEVERFPWRVDINFVNKIDELIVDLEAMKNHR